MKKQICLFFTILALCSSFISCEKEGNSDNSLVGTWLCVKEETTMSDGTVYTYTDKSDWSLNSSGTSFPYLLTFSSDGVISGRTYLEVEGLPINYTLKNGYICGLGIQVWKIVSNNGKTLVLELSDAQLELDKIAQETLYPGAPLCVKSVATYTKQ